MVIIVKKELLLPFTSLSKRGVHKESKDEFEKSFFKHIYEQAYRAVDSILRANDKMQYLKGERFDLYRTPNIQNVISFTGRRGTGKTSAMTNFANALHNGIYNEGSQMLNGYFFAIPCIDAAVLEKNEDVFDVILSNMLLTLEREVESCRFAYDFTQNIRLDELKKMMCDVFNQYTSLKVKFNNIVANGLEDDISSYHALISTAKRHDIRNNFADLVKQYLGFMKGLYQENHINFSNNDKPEYLVICIDDIDMANYNHMEILHCIYQYLMIPGMVVLTAYNVDVITKIIEKHFYNMFSTSNQSEYIIRNDAREQAYDFLRKINSSDMRITMPSWKRSDYRSLIEIQVDFGKNTNENKNQIKKMFAKLQEKNLILQYLNSIDDTEKSVTLTPKQLIMFMLADRTGLYLDGMGKKLHFMEPDSLRNLYDLFYLLYNFKDIRSKEFNGNYKYSPQNMENIRANYKMLLDHFHFKMVHELCLSDSDYNVFKSFRTETIYRRGERIFAYYRNSIQDLKSNIESSKVRIYPTHKSVIEKEYDNKSSYSYGELFYILYVGSRIDLLSKNLIKAILASYSFTLPYTFIEYIALKKEKMGELDQYVTDSQKTCNIDNLIEERKYELYDIFGNTLLGTWNQRLTNSKQMQISIEKDDSNSKFIHLILLCMLYSKDYKYKITSKPEKNMEFKCKDNKIFVTMDFDPTAIVMNSFRYNEFFEYMRLKIKNLGSDLSIKLENAINNLEDIFECYDRKIYFALPLQNMDLIYNIIKRSVSKMLYINDFVTEEQDIWFNSPFGLLKQLYLNIYKELKNIDDFYKFKDNKHSNFTNRFISCPLVYCVLKRVTENEDKSLFLELEDLKENFDWLKKLDPLSISLTWRS